MAQVPTDTSIQTLLQGGQPVEALKQLAAALIRAPSDPALYLQASRALVAALDHPKDLAAWNEAPRHALYHQLLRHAPCPAPMPTLAHEAASNLTSGNRDVVTALVAELRPVLRHEWADGRALPPTPDAAFKNVLIFLLTTRAVSRSVVPDEALSQLHVSWFETFSAADLALPYSVMFNPDVFGQNRAELLAAYWPGPDRTELHRLPPDRVLFFSWLAGRPVFNGPDELAVYLDRHLPGSDEDCAAARALLLRHWEGPAPDRLQAWGLADLADLLARPAPMRAVVPSRIGARLLETRPYQALNAAIQRYAPALTGRGKPKVAICLSGQLRGYEMALASWRTSILRSIEPVFFIHSWTGIGQSDAQPFRYVLPFAGEAFPKAYRQIALATGYADMRERYPSLFQALNHTNKADVEQLKAFYDTDHVVLEDDTAPRFADLSNQQKMHYKIHAADQLAQIQGGFNLHMRLRPDLAMDLVGFDWRDLAAACTARPMVFAEKPYGLHYNNLMIGDQCAVARPDVMRTYAGTWEVFPTLARAQLARCPETFTGHVSLATTAWLSGLDVARLPIRFGTLQDANPLRSVDICKALEADSRNDANDRQLLQAVRADLGS